ncbi:MAG: CvpA family protein [Petrimonas sp.]|jgi:membrane protein required for colicin V production|nr:CvpA family protein [Petrimonas sp.]HMM18879.1 CvpA family protein [Petrimonas sp.]
MLNGFDLIILIFLLVAFVNGYRKGLVMMLVGLATVILAAVFAGKLAITVLPYLQKTFDFSPQVTHVLSYVAAFLAIAAVVSLIGFLVQKVFESVNLNFINRALGGVVSIGTTVVVLSILLNLILMLDGEEKIVKPDIKQKSFFYEKVRVAVPAIVPYLNKEVWEEFVPEKYRKQIEDSNGSNYDTENGQPIDSAFQKKYFETDSI